MAQEPKFVDLGVIKIKTISADRYIRMEDDRGNKIEPVTHVRITIDDGDGKSMSMSLPPQQMLEFAEEVAHLATK